MNGAAATVEWERVDTEFVDRFLAARVTEAESAAFARQPSEVVIFGQKKGSGLNGTVLPPFSALCFSLKQPRTSPRRSFTEPLDLVRPRGLQP